MKSPVRPAGAASPVTGARSAPVAPILFLDRGCPTSHRVLALFAHLGCARDLREVLLGDKPEGIERYSSSGRLPVLVHGDLVLTESRVMLEHLAEYHGLQPYPPSLTERTLHRHAMAVVDDYLVPVLFRRIGVEAGSPRLDDTLRVLAAAAATVTPPRPCLLTLHIAPVWLRFRTWHPQGAVTRGVEARPELCRWLDAATRLDCVAGTAPDPATDAEDLARALRAGLLPPNDP